MLIKKKFEIFEKKCARKECCHFNEVGRKVILLLFCFVRATQNKAMHMMNLVSILFFIKEFMV